jgi:2'-5' RNA ligase
MSDEHMLDRPGEAAAGADAARVFLGIKLSMDIAKELATIALELERFDVRPVAADDMHLTLVPPWPEDSVPNAIDRLHRAVTGCPAFALAITHVGYGPDQRRPRLLWADCATVDELEALRNALLAGHAQTDERPYRPHVALARIRQDGRTIARRHPIDRPVAFSQWVDAV